MALASGAYFGRTDLGFLAPLGIFWISDLLVNNILYASFITALSFLPLDLVGFILVLLRSLYWGQSC